MRESAVLMHITSLPGPYGIGTMGKQAFAFVDFLKKAGQRCWQVLPLNPTGYGDSPYQSCCANAGNPYLIDLDVLVEEGLLEQKELDEITWNQCEGSVDFGRLYNNRMGILRKAYARFGDNEECARFRAANDGWLPDFALYMALKEKFNGKPWCEWDDDLKFRRESAWNGAFGELIEEVRFYCFVQYQFDKQWNALRSYAHEKGICIIGDVPIYVPYDSVDVWSNPELFQLDEGLTPTAVAGCPPDAFTEDGQLWGNPLYHWDRMKKDGYSWWLSRLNAAGKRYDRIRLDHFRAFEAYWSVPYGERTARNGKWMQGPGLDFLNTVKRKLPKLQLIAEDLGFLTPEVLQLRDAAGFPGMKVLQFAFDSREPSAYLPYCYSPNSVCYTGTHDNMTTRQWLETADADTVAYAAEYMHLTKEEGYTWGVIRTAFSSVSGLCVVPAQDFLDLGPEARMNFPGTMGNNWTWRASDGVFTDVLAAKIRSLTKLYGRLTEEGPLSKNGEQENEL